MGSTKTYDFIHLSKSTPQCPLGEQVMLVIKADDGMKYILSYNLDGTINLGPDSMEPKELERVSAEFIGVHRSHCCTKHGCKYGEPDECVVALELMAPEDEMCGVCWEQEEYEREASTPEIGARLRKALEDDEGRQVLLSGSWQFSPSTLNPQERSVALRFSVPCKSGKLLVETSSYFCPKFVRLRGPGTLVQAWVDNDPNILAGPVALEYFADRGGHPASPRAQISSDYDSIDDSSDGPPVDWPVFGPDHPLSFQIEQAEPYMTLHVVLTGLALTYPCHPGFGPTITAPLWPTARFRYADEEGWKSATVVDYATRAGSMGGTGHGHGSHEKSGSRDQ